MTIRVFVPTTSARLAEIVAARRIAGPVRAHAVTEALRREWPEGDQDQWEYAVLAIAAEASASLRGPGDRPRRYVLAIDAESVTELAGDDPTAVQVSHDLAWSAIASAHVDTADDVAPDEDLAWFARQEIPDLL